MKKIKLFIHWASEKMGIRFYRIRKPVEIKPVEYKQQHLDIERILNKPDPVIFDIGANTGQTIKGFRAKFPESIIYAFEPGIETFNYLQQLYKHTGNVHLHNIAFGAEKSRLIFHDNEYNVMSSFLENGSKIHFGEIIETREIELTTVDDFCMTHDIKKIDVLKIDTQGFDLEVLKGALNMLPNVSIILTEITIYPLYKNLPELDEVLLFLREKGFKFANLYEANFRNEVLAWADFMFVNNDLVNWSQYCDKLVPNK
ncbi:MAG: FkbM family methyltransferase [Bacteroidota bacterium]|nr:FkbM family methyltransferase [Bacteroidota bacterium]